jgi:Gamma-glutamyl cyclotransferase, AIG2-like
MVPRRADVFFYGLFMDEELLRAKGLQPEQVEQASIAGMSLKIGQRAALVPAPGQEVYGAVMSLTLAEVEQLYSDPSVAMYRPEAVLIHPASGGVIAALCYNLPDPPSPSGHNPDYAAKLREVARRVGLPEAYVAGIE